MGVSIYTPVVTSSVHLTCNPRTPSSKTLPSITHRASKQEWHWATEDGAQDVFRPAAEPWAHAPKGLGTRMASALGLSFGLGCSPVCEQTGSPEAGVQKGYYNPY